jgi:hypothetical protein
MWKNHGGAGGASPTDYWDQTTHQFNGLLLAQIQSDGFPRCSTVLSKASIARLSFTMELLHIAGFR